MSITNLNMLSNAASYGAYNQKLTQTTKQKLDELGITYNSGITEQEAQKLIAKYQSLSSNKTSKDGAFSQGESAKDEVTEQLKKLAQKLGIATGEKPDFDKLIKEVENTLEQKILSSKNDISQLQTLKSLSYELANIQSQSQAGSQMSYDTSNQALMMSLEMLSQYNKNFLNR